MGTINTEGLVSVDGRPPVAGRLTIDRPVEEVRSSGPRPDDRWTFVDKRGHFHAYNCANDRDLYPTLTGTEKRKPCDGSCGGVCDGEYTVTVYRCRACGKRVKPGISYREERVTIPGRTIWHTTVEALVEGDLVSVLLDTGSGVAYFGFAKPVAWHVDYAVTSRRTELIGVGVLGRTLATPRREASS